MAFEMGFEHMKRTITSEKELLKEERTHKTKAQRLKCVGHVWRIAS